MEEFLYKIDKIQNAEHRKILPMLFPNYVTIFPIKLKEKELNNMFKNDVQFFMNLLPAVIKNKWNYETISYDFDNGGLSLNTITEETPQITVNNYTVTDPEIYAYNLRHSPDYTDFLFCHGVYLAAEKLGIITGHSKLTRNNISIFSENSEFQSISLRSLEVQFQLQLFAYYIDKNIVFVTGGTGIGKTSQIPKLLFWFDTLFAWDNKNNNHYHTLLSLPKIQLVNFFGSNFNNSINSSEFIHKYYYGSEGHIKDNSKTKMIVCTNKISSKRFLHAESKNKMSSIILDEIHEYDIHTIINLCLIKKYRSLFGAIILMSATPGNNLAYLNQYFLDVKVLALPNIQLHKITTIDMYDESLNFIQLVTNAIKKHKPKKNEAGIVFCSTVMEIHKLYKHLEQEFNKLKILKIYSKSITLKDDIDSINDIPEPLIILSTNLLESSVTIQKLKYVYDLGKNINVDFYKIERYNISEESMLQRRGRVGRVSPGKYIKLYDKLGTYNFLEHIFLYPIIIFDQVYKFKNIYSFDESFKKRYKVEKLYFNKVYKEFEYDNLLRHYNNNLCTNFESILVYTLPYYLANIYKEIENKPGIELKTMKFDINKLSRIARKLGLKLQKENKGKSNIYSFIEEFYKKNKHVIINPFIIGTGKSCYFITPSLVIKL